MTTNPYFTEHAVAARRAALRAEAQRSRQVREVRALPSGTARDRTVPARRLARLRIRWAH
jgi:hypothetical protein